MIYIPRVHDEYVSQRMLVLEWIDGIKASFSFGLAGLILLGLLVNRS